MPLFLEKLIPYLALLASVIVTQFLLIYYHCYETSRGYICSAARKLWMFLFIAIIFQCAMAYSIYEFFILHFLFSSHFVQKAVSGILVGFVAVALPNGAILSAMTYYLSRKSVDLSKELAQPLSRFVLWVWVLRRIQAEIQYLKSNDNFDMQFQTGSWDFNISDDPKVAEREAGRRLRLLYELYKAEIANKKRAPHLMCIDVNYFPGNKFFLLLSYLGKAKVRELLRVPVPSPPPGRNWNGKERRKVRGSKADRHQPDFTTEYTRVSDDVALLELIQKGKLYD